MAPVMHPSLLVILANCAFIYTPHSLLDLREQCLHEMGFRDIFEGIKRQENAAALEVLPKMLTKLDKLPEDIRIETLIQNVLAGNMYDWYVKMHKIFSALAKFQSMVKTYDRGSTSVQEMLRRVSRVL